MAIKFNPLTGNFDFTGSGGGGGGSAFFAGEVATYADLPLDGTAALDSRWLVRSNSGTWPFSSYKQAGVYVRKATVGASRDNDYQLTDTSFFDVMSDNTFLVYDDADATKNLKFQLSGITTGQTRTLTAPDASGVIVLGNDTRIATIGSATINTSAVNGSAGSINTSDNNGQSSGGSIDTSGSNEAGGSILTYGGASEAGGSISTYNGGGSINTRGTGSIELGGTGTRTTLTGTATEDRAISLPNASGTLALASLVGAPAELVIACSDETTNLTTGTNKVTFRMPYAMTLSSVRASVNTAPTGSTLVVDINEGGSTILSTKLSIDASEFTSTTAATAAVISDTALADDALITIDIDQIGSTIAGKGLKVVLKGTRA
jgi:hypothetical protein